MRKGTWRLVTGTPRLSEGRGSVLGPDTSRRARWWVLPLECGHKAESAARYRPHQDGYPAQRGGTQHRSRDDVLPPPKQVLCSLGDCRT